MAPLTNKQIKNKCSISYPNRDLRPTATLAAFISAFKAGGHWKEDNSIPENVMHGYAGLTVKIPIVLTHIQCSQKNRGISRYITRLRDLLAEDGLYVSKRKKEYVVLKRKDNLDLAVRPRNRKAKKAFERNHVLITNTPLVDCPNKPTFLSDNNQLILDVSNWV